MFRIFFIQITLARLDKERDVLRGYQRKVPTMAAITAGHILLEPYYEKILVPSVPGTSPITIVF
jgi:hypothetical protein